MKKTIALLLALVLCLSLCGCDSVTNILTPSVEGKGYDSPEEAFLAYTEALKTGDVSKILATFSIETYVENYDLEAYLDYVHSYMPSLTIVDQNNPFTQDISLITRQYQITQQLRNLYTFFALGENAFNGAISFNGKLYDDADDFMKDYVMDDWMEILAEMQVDDDFTYLDDVMDSKNLDLTEKSLEDRCDYYGCREIVPLALEVELDGEEYLMTMDVARYGDKWYNLTPQGTIAMVMGAPAMVAGLCSEY